ncbi:hypothetical protein DJ017_06780 [Phenylobacterium soli]|uniref:Type II/III secretion system secretin-like domain-containing protein n=1 Tax=Phenylobacterium soli TaxID=2170551 RepID=A0A328AMX3_9CAUL|nr:hypothetical protein DJ017_06780 [Phenylobacterium soli]
MLAIGVACSIGLQGAPAVAAGQAAEAAAASRPAPQREALSEPARLGLEALKRGDLAEANRQFAMALARDPRNPGLNSLNALAYQRRFEAGERDLFGLAETGYRAALDARQDSLPLALQLARLYFDDGRWAEAEQAAAYALDVEPHAPDALRLLAASAYYAGDVQLALWAVEDARKRGLADRDIAAIRPLVYAQAGLDEPARQALGEAVAAGAVAPARQARLDRRIDQWRDLWTDAAFKTAAAAPVTAPVVAPAAAAPTTPPPPAPVDAAPASLAWWDCQQQLTQTLTIPNTLPQVPTYSTSTTSIVTAPSTADETSALPPLPAPCRGRPLPRMAMMDTVILRTDDIRTDGHGLNLLDGLSFFVGDSISLSKTITNGVVTKQRTWSRGVSLGDAADSGIAYSLNIANASNERTDVLARPSLLALDRQPAMFFSGSTVSVALISPQGGGGTIQDKPVGVSLSVTPTFVDDDTMLVSVKAVRSFFEETAPSATFAQSVQTSRNMVTANVMMRYGQTLILSGLSEREEASTDSRTPVLGKAPGLQYLFRRRDSRDFTRSVVILLTPRRVREYQDEGADALKLGTEPPLMAETRGRAARDLAAMQPNLPVALKQMDRNRLYRAARTGDVELPHNDGSNGLDGLFHDFANLIYY